jgi:hypothetical protein
MAQDRDAAIRAKAALDSLQASEGWRYVTAYGNDLIDALIQQGDSAKTGEEAMKILGAITTLRQFLKWPKIQSAMLQQHTQENNQ